MEVFAAIIQKYGIAVAVSVYVGEKLFLWLGGYAWKWKKSVEANTAAINGLRGEMAAFREDVKTIPKVHTDLRVAFHNIKLIKDKLKMGGITLPESKLDQ